MHWIYLKGTVDSSVSKGLCGKVSKVTGLKKFLQFETILRTLNTEFLTVFAPPDLHYWDRLAPQKRTPLFKILCTGLKPLYYKRNIGPKVFTIERFHCKLGLNLLCSLAPLL